MYHLSLTNDERQTVCRFLNRLCDENGWLNSKWVEEGDVHEIAVLYRLRDRIDLNRLSSATEEE